MIYLKNISTLALLVALGFPVPGRAATYNVELLVFRHLDTVYSSPEGAPANTVDDPSDEEFARYQRLTRDKFKFDGARRLIGRSARYRPLLHTGWQQEGLSPEDSKWQRIDRDTGADGALSGRVKFSVSRYLHLEIDLSYLVGANESYHLNERRLVRSNSKHYFDHPRFGVLAIVTRAEEKSADTDQPVESVDP